MDGLSNRAEGTRRNYLEHLERFCEYVGKTPDELRQMKWLENQSEKPWERNEVENLVRAYLSHLERVEGLSCSYAQGAFYAIRSCFIKNGMPLNMDGNDMPEGVSFGSAVPSSDQVRQIVDAAGTLRYRALILFLKDSGLRISDVVRFKWGDLTRVEEDFYGFQIVTKKRKAPASGFVGPETSDALRHYKEKRLQGTRKIPREQKIEEHFLFCARTQPTTALTVSAVSKNIGDIIRRLRFTDLKPHGLRKFWEQNVQVQQPVYKKRLNGRKLTKYEAAYLEQNPKDLFMVYKANYDNLRVFEQPVIKQDEIEAIVERRVEERVAYLQGELAEVKRLLQSPELLAHLRRVAQDE